MVITEFITSMLDYNLEFITRIGGSLFHYSLKKRKEPGRQREERVRDISALAQASHQ